MMPRRPLRARWGSGCAVGGRARLGRSRVGRGAGVDWALHGSGGRFAHRDRAALRCLARRARRRQRARLAQAAPDRCHPPSADTGPCRKWLGRRLHGRAGGHAERDRGSLPGLARATRLGEHDRPGRAAADRGPSACPDRRRGDDRSRPDRRDQSLPARCARLRPQLPELHHPHPRLTRVRGDRTQRGTPVHDQPVLRERVGCSPAAAQRLHQHRLRIEPGPAHHPGLRRRREERATRDGVTARLRRRLQRGRRRDRDARDDATARTLARRRAREHLVNPQELNAATIKGILDHLLTHSPQPTVGIYSNANFWLQIVGRWSSLSVPEWIATGAPDPPGCPAGFAAGPVWVSQSTDGQHDSDKIC